MKGIILAGGSGTRLYPITRAVSKQRLPVYDKPMIYFPLRALMLAGIREVLIISTPDDQAAFQCLLGDGSQWGISLSYAVQPKSDGIAQAFIIGREFIGNDTVALILGDTIFFGHGLAGPMKAAQQRSGTPAFAYRVQDPEPYGVVSFDRDGRATEIVEKPEYSKSKWVVTGLYLYGSDVASSIKPSPRGELEITDVNARYLEEGRLFVERRDRGYALLDTGTHESMLEAAEFVRVIQRRQGQQIASVDEVAFYKGYISAEKLAS